jgi:hypothetical protein
MGSSRTSADAGSRVWWHAPLRAFASLMRDVAHDSRTLLDDTSAPCIIALLIFRPADNVTYFDFKTDSANFPLLPHDLAFARCSAYELSFCRSVGCFCKTSSRAKMVMDWQYDASSTFATATCPWYRNRTVDTILPICRITTPIGYACIVSFILFSRSSLRGSGSLHHIVAQHGLYWVCSGTNIWGKSAYNCIAPGQKSSVPVLADGVGVWYQSRMRPIKMSV